MDILTKKEDSLDFVELIKNDNTLSIEYKDKFIDKLKEEFTVKEQNLYIVNLYMYLHYDDNEFCIDLDNVYKWIGFANKGNAKACLRGKKDDLTIKKKFTADTDYKIVFLRTQKNSKNGRPEEKIMLKVDTFKILCLLANTETGKEIRKYYIKLEKINNYLAKQQLIEAKEKQKFLEDKISGHEVEKQLEREKALIEKFPKNTQCIYYGKIDNKSEFNENLIKFGNSNDLPSRIKNHKKTYTNFVLLNAFKVPNQLESENIIKKHKILSHKLRKIYGKEDNKFTELIAYNDSDFTLEDFNKILLDIVSDSDCTINKELELNRIDLEKTKQLTIIECEKTKQLTITECEKTKQMSIELENNKQLAIIHDQKLKLIQLDLENNKQLVIIESEKNKQLILLEQEKTKQLQCQTELNKEKEKTKQTQAIAGNSRPINNTIIYNNSQEIIDNGQNEAFTFNKFLEETITFVADNKSFIKRDDLYKCYFEWITTKYDRPVIVPSNGGKFSILINSKLKDFYKRTGPKHIEIIDENNNVTYKDGRYWRLINHKFIESPPVYESTN